MLPHFINCCYVVTRNVYLQNPFSQFWYFRLWLCGRVSASHLHLALHSGNSVERACRTHMSTRVKKKTQNKYIPKKITYFLFVHLFVPIKLSCLTEPRAKNMSEFTKLYSCLNQAPSTVTALKEHRVHRVVNPMYSINLSTEAWNGKKRRRRNRT